MSPLNYHPLRPTPLLYTLRGIQKPGSPEGDFPEPVEARPTGKCQKTSLAIVGWICLGLLGLAWACLDLLELAWAGLGVLAFS